MVEYLPRSAWDAAPARGGPGALTVSRVQGAVIHWPGMGARRLIRAADVAAALRSWQDYHQNVKAWSDIAYQVAVDQAGRAWTLRGLLTQSGANGNEDLNERFGAILLVLGSGEHPTPEMIATTREVIRDFREIYPAGDQLEPHSAVRPGGTDCPGDAARELIEAGAFEPGTITQEDWFDMANTEEIEAAVKAGVLGALREYGSALFKDEQGTADTLWDEARAHRKAELERLDAIAANTKP